jgi:hypothetical protein
LSIQLSICFQIQIELSSTSCICPSCLHNSIENKPPLYQVANKIPRNKIIPLVQKLTQLEEHLISPCLAFAQIYKLQGYGQYKMHGSVINVLANVDQTQSIPCLPHDGATICVFFKQRLEYKSLYMLENVHPNMVMVILRDIIETPLYKHFNVTIHHQCASLLALHMNSKSQIPAYNNASFDNNEKVHCTPTNSTMHNFLDVPKIMDYENTIYSITQVKTFTL